MSNWAYLRNYLEYNMFVYVGFDDTDTVEADRGTGKLARWFERELPEDCHLWGVVRQQLLVNDLIPYTSHNSSACAIINIPDIIYLQRIITKAIAHIERYSLDGSDPGLCVACETHPAMQSLIEFGISCTRRVVTQQDALQAASQVHLSAHGGTNDGIIGAAAAVGLTASGWCGRFIEFGGLRKFSELTSVAELEHNNIHVVSIDRDASIPAPEDMVNTNGWLRPRLWGKRPVLIVRPKGEGMWESYGEKRHKQRKDPSLSQ
jgi:hypothetical protein